MFTKTKSFIVNHKFDIACVAILVTSAAISYKLADSKEELATEPCDI